MNPDGRSVVQGEINSKYEKKLVEKNEMKSIYSKVEKQREGKKVR